MKQVIIDGVLHNYEEQDWATYGWPKDPSIRHRIFTCPIGEKFVRKSKHDIICELSGKFRTNGHTYEFKN